MNVELRRQVINVYKGEANFAMLETCPARD